MIVVTDDSTPEQIHEAIGYLRDRQRRCELQSVRDELAEAIDDLLDRLS